jgi:hypothetical protein
MNFVTLSGKDSCCYAMMSNPAFIPKVLLNMMNENGKVSRSHGLPLSILNQQVKKKWIASRNSGKWVIMKSSFSSENAKSQI